MMSLHFVEVIIFQWMDFIYNSVFKIKMTKINNDLETAKLFSEQQKQKVKVCFHV